LAIYLVKTKKKLNEIKQNIDSWPQFYTSRKINIIINKLKIGHTRLTHEYLMENKEQTICTSSNKALIIITNCRSYHSERIKYSFPTNLYENIGLEINVDLIPFLKDTGLYKLIKKTIFVCINN
jgi:hypothetical protein